MAGNNLFMSQRDAAIAEQLQRRQVRDPQAALTGSLFDLGHVGGNALIRGFGGDSRTPMQRRGAEVQGLVKGTDFKDPESIHAAVRRLNDNGFQAEAEKFLSLVPQQAEVKPHVIGYGTESKTLGDTSTDVEFEYFSDGTKKVLDKITNKNTGLGNNVKDLKMNQDWTRSPIFKPEDSALIEAQLRNNPIFEGMIATDNDEGEVKPLLGRILNLAGQLKKRHHDSIVAAVHGGGMDRVVGQNEIPLNPSEYLNIAYQRYVESNGIEADVNTGFGINGADISPAAFTDTSNLDATDAQISKSRKKFDAVSKVAARQASLVVGDPNTSDFRLSKMSPQQAQQVFSRMDGKSDEQLQQELGGMGFQFNGAMLETHAQRWQIMRENPAAVASFIANSDNPDLRGAEATRYLNTLDENNNFQQFATASAIFSYLSRLSDPKSVSKVHPRSRRKVK